VIYGTTITFDWKYGGRKRFVKRTYWKEKEIYPKIDDALS